MTVNAEGDRDLEERCKALRGEVRAFLAEEIATGRFTPRCDAWLGGFDRDFARRVAARGWLGMPWPKRYGGHERSQLERFVVVEEMIAAGAPIASYHSGDRQVGPQILKYGTEYQKELIVPAIARGECVIAIGLSEPDSGSDLASIRCRAEPIDGGWRITGTKIWTSHAHEADYIIVLCRTGSRGDARHAGLSQLIVKLPDPKVQIRPIRLMSGSHHFNQVYFDGVEVPAEMLLGTQDQAWSQLSAELAMERSGPERFLSAFPLLPAAIAAGRANEDREFARTVGVLSAQIWSLRSLSVTIANMLEAGEDVNTAASIVKDAGTSFEGDMIEALRPYFPPAPSLEAADGNSALFARALLHMPGYTLRGGTSEIMRGIIARSLGLR